MANYIAIVHKEAESDFGVSFPDFPGCITAGKDIDEAKDMAHHAKSSGGSSAPGVGLPLSHAASTMPSMARHSMSR